MLLVNFEPDFVEQTVNYLGGGALNFTNSDLSNGLDVFLVAFIRYKSCVVLHPTFVHFFSIKPDATAQDILWTRWDGFYLVGQHQESLIVDEENKGLLALLIEVKQELPRSVYAL